MTPVEVLPVFPDFDVRFQTSNDSSLKIKANCNFLHWEILAIWPLEWNFASHWSKFSIVNDWYLSALWIVKDQNWFFAYLICIVDTVFCKAICFVAMETSICPSHFWLWPCSQGSTPAGSDGRDVSGHDQVCVNSGVVSDQLEHSTGDDLLFELIYCFQDASRGIFI